MPKFICLFALMVFASIPLCAQLTKIAVQKGQKYTVESSTTMASSTDSAIQNIESNSTTITVYEIESVGKKEIELHSTIASIKTKIELSMLGKKETFNDTANRGDHFSQQLTIGNDGYIIKTVETEKPPLDENSWTWIKSARTTDLFIPALLGKEFKPGNSYPTLDSFDREKPGTSFSFNKDQIHSRDSGTYTIISIQDNIAHISYTGTRVAKMTMTTMDQQTSSLISSLVNSIIQMDMRTGMLVSNTTTETGAINTGSPEKPGVSTTKSSSTLRITLMQ